MKTKWIIAIAVVGLGQLATPVYLIARHEHTLRGGEVFRFHTAPVDPSDAFRGRFVALSLTPNRVKANEGIVMKHHSRRVYVTLGRDDEGFAVLHDIQVNRPDSGSYLPARVWGADTGGYSRVQFDLDRYYLPEGEAPAAERAYREHSRREKQEAEAVVRVLNGDAVIEDLRVEGKSIRAWIVEEGQQP